MNVYGVGGPQLAQQPAQGLEGEDDDTDDEEDEEDDEEVADAQQDVPPVAPAAPNAGAAGATLQAQIRACMRAAAGPLYRWRRKPFLSDVVVCREQ